MKKCERNEKKNGNKKREKEGDIGNNTYCVNQYKLFENKQNGHIIHINIQF